MLLYSRDIYFLLCAFRRWCKQAITHARKELIDVKDSIAHFPILPCVSCDFIGGADDFAATLPLSAAVMTAAVALTEVSNSF